MTFGKRLKELMAANGLTERGLAEKSGVSYGAIQGYVINRRIPGFDVVLKLAKALGTSCDVFAECTFEYEPQTPKTKRRKANQ